MGDIDVTLYDSDTSPPMWVALVLDCVDCDGFKDWNASGDSDGVYCDDCGKRHGTDSLAVIDPVTGEQFGEGA